MRGYSAGVNTKATFFLLPRAVVGATSLALWVGADGAAVRADIPTARFPRLPYVLAQASPDAAAAAATSDSLRPVERMFIVQGLEQSRTEAELSRLAVSQASRSDIRDFAQQLVADSRDINGSLETLARRKTVAVPIQPVSFSDRYRDLAGRSGSAFDRAFIEEIAAANARTLRLCESAVANAKDADIRELAGNLLPIVRDHANKTTELRKSL